MLDLHPNMAVRWMREAGGDWSRYAAEVARPIVTNMTNAPARSPPQTHLWGGTTLSTSLRAGVPIVPVVSVGGQETALFLTRGEWLAKLLRLDYAAREGEYFTIRSAETYRRAEFVIRQTAACPIVAPRVGAEYFRNSLLALYPWPPHDSRYVAGLLTVGSFLPQVMRAWRTKQTRDLSMSMFALLVTSGSLWVVYGVINRDWPVIATNSGMVALSSALADRSQRHLQPCLLEHVGMELEDRLPQRHRHPRGGRVSGGGIVGPGETEAARGARADEPPTREHREQRQLALINI